MTDFSQLSSAFDKAATIALFVTAGVLLLIAVIYLLVKKFNPEAQKTAKLLSAGFLLGYAVGLLAVLFYLKLDEYIAAGYIDTATFVPVVCILGAAVALSVGALIVSVFKKDALRVYSIVSFSLLGICALVLFIINMVRTYGENGAKSASDEAMLYIFSAAIVAAIAAAALLFGKSTKKSDHTKSIVYAAISIAASFALSYVRFLELPQGGSVTFASLVPLMVYSYMFGARKGVLAGAVYGLLQFIQAPWFIHPMQFLLDYPIAFAAVGLSGMFRELNLFREKAVLQFALGATAAVALRYLSHVISGIFIWGSADAAYNAVAWSFLYNSFALADLAIALVAGCALFASRAFRRQFITSGQTFSTDSPRTENATTSYIAPKDEE
jgi:thiamine transporter